jgi:putative oxidoreductase
MFAGHTALEIAGQVVIAVYFLAMLGKNMALWDFNMERTGAILPLPAVVLVSGFAVQIAGALSLLFDFHAHLGAIALICFTFAATAMFHRFWSMDDPLRRNYHMLLLANNVAITGGLILVMGIAWPG